MSIVIIGLHIMAFIFGFIIGYLIGEIVWDY